MSEHLSGHISFTLSFVKAWLEWPSGIWTPVLHVRLYSGAVPGVLQLRSHKVLCSVQCIFLNGNYINTVKSCVSGKCVHFLVGSREHFSFGFCLGSKLWIS